VEILTGVNIREVRRDGDEVEVLYESDGKTRTARAAVVANGTGRVPALDELDLQRASVKLDGGKPVLRPDLSAEGNPNIYFAGDAHPGRQQLSPVASWMGRIAANNLLGRTAIIPDFSSIPSVVFSIPAIASVGTTEETAQKNGIAFEVKRSDMRSWRSARTYVEDVAFAKVLVERKGGRILGAQLAGHQAQETIHGFAMAIRFGITAEQLREFVYAYPTHFSDMKYVV
jgi:glutathione reductase (NADPH)